MPAGPNPAWSAGSATREFSPTNSVRAALGHHLPPGTDRQGEQPVPHVGGDLGQRHTHLLRHGQRTRIRSGPLVLLGHSGPLPRVVLSDTRDLPVGRPRRGPPPQLPRDPDNLFTGRHLSRSGYRGPCSQSGLLRIDHAAITTESHLDGTWLLRTSDTTLTPEDLAAAYPQLLAVEYLARHVGHPSGCGRCSTTARTASAPTSSCAGSRCYLTRVIENTTGQTWRTIRNELDRLHLVTLAHRRGARRATLPGHRGPDADHQRARDPRTAQVLRLHHRLTPGQLPATTQQERRVVTRPQPPASYIRPGQPSLFTDPCAHRLRKSGQTRGAVSASSSPHSRVWASGVTAGRRQGRPARGGTRRQGALLAASAASSASISRSGPPTRLVAAIDTAGKVTSWSRSRRSQPH